MRREEWKRTIVWNKTTCCTQKEKSVYTTMQDSRTKANEGTACGVEERVEVSRASGRSESQLLDSHGLEKGTLLLRVRCGESSDN